jgi:hypothetical protein
MKPHTLTGKPAVPGMVQVPPDQHPDARVLQTDVVPFPEIPQSAVSCAVLFAQFSAVVMANLMLMSSLAANSLAANRPRRGDH